MILHLATIGNEYDKNYDDDDVAATLVVVVTTTALVSDGCDKGRRNNNTCGSGA